MKSFDTVQITKHKQEIKTYKKCRLPQITYIINKSIEIVCKTMISKLLLNSEMGLSKSQSNWKTSKLANNTNLNHTIKNT